MKHEKIKSKQNPFDLFQQKKQVGDLFLIDQDQFILAFQPSQIFSSLKKAEVCVKKDQFLFGFKSFDSFFESRSEYNYKKIDEGVHVPDEVWVFFKEFFVVQKTEDGYWLYEQVSDMDLDTDKIDLDSLPKAKTSFSKTKWHKHNENIKFNMSQEDYFSRVERVKEDIARGDYYQVNLSLVMQKKINKDPWTSFESYYQRSPFSYGVYWDFGKWQILSFSPELFFRKEKNKIIARPIKGTASLKTGKEKLYSSEKDQAELNMITDLFRNELNSFCKNVKVIKDREILKLNQLYHMYSEIEGVLESNQTFSEILENMFPSGSISGCPKLRSLKAIRDLEDCKRGIYTGSLGYIYNDIFQMNVAIRTALIIESDVYFSSGSGLVYDSVPEAEWEECLLKAKTFLEIF